MRWPVARPVVGVWVPVFALEERFAVSGRDFGGESDEEVRLLATGL